MFVFPKAKNENQEKLFTRLKLCCSYYERALLKNEPKELLIHQAFGMIQLYIDLFPEEGDEICDLWTNELLVYFLNKLRD